MLQLFDPGLDSFVFRFRRTPIIVLPVIGGGATLFLWCQLSVAAKIVGFSWLALGAIILGIKTKGFKEMPPEMDFSEAE